MSLHGPSVSVCEELGIWEPSRQDVKKKMPPGSRNDQRCTNSFSYEMEVCRRQRRDETLQAYITIASGKSFHHEQGCYRASADPSIGHCLQWQHPKEQHTVLIFGALGALHRSLGEPLETELP